MARWTALTSSSVPMIADAPTVAIEVRVIL
jgi:hypothetical protein